MAVDNGVHAPAVSFTQLFMISTAGEAVNATTPTGYVGGEPVKAYLLNRHGIPMVDGFASVIIAKITMTIAQVAYILLGISLGFWLFLPPREVYFATLIVLSVGLFLFGVALFVTVQRYGLFANLFSLLGKCSVWISFLAARRQSLLSLDHTILAFLARSRDAFLLSIAAFFTGWLIEVFEILLIVHFLGSPIDMLTAFSIGALSTFIKGATFFVPGSVGVQEVGNLMLITTYGHSEVIGMTFALLRRVRELAWIAIGIDFLALLGRGTNSAKSTSQ